MARKRIFFISLFVVSVVGLAIIQYRYLRIGLNLARVQFSQKIAEAGAEIRQDLYGRNQLTFLLANALEQDTSFFRTDPAQLTDASRYFLKDYLRERLVDHQIDRDFSFSLMARDSSYYLQSTAVIPEEEQGYTYPMELQGYLPERFGKRMVLQLEFRNLNRYFLSQLSGLTLPTLLFLVGIVAVVLWVLRTYYWQRKVITTTNEFINNLTHELRTPVFSISLAAKILNEKLAGSYREYTESILNQTKKLSAHIDKVLELGALEHTRTLIQKEELNFRPVLDRLCRDFLDRCQMEGQEFEYRLEEGPYPMRASVFHLENAVNNLLDNARKYGEDSEISLAAGVRGDLLEIKIRNGGTPIPPEALEELFKKYYRLPRGDRQKIRGYGLGLSYVRTIAERHQGKVSIRSNPKIGTVVEFVLPLLRHGN
ncbi:MAG: two-component sensor histidine kinase [Flavobacteriaceae bacterium]|nr:MAG: two-component sensor histidine kinase [Flavobacteriaceae bacterium]